MRASALLLVLGVTFPLSCIASDTPSVSTSVEFADSDNLFQLLLDEAKALDPLFHSVTDRNSAEKAADELEMRIERMKLLLKQQETAAVTSGNAQTIATQMSSLTYVTQGVIPTIQKLVEVNAYGSDKLLNIMRRYLASQNSTIGSEMEESPQIRLYEEMVDSMGDILYILRKVQDPTTAQAAATALRSAVSERERLQTLISSYAPAPIEDLRAIRERLLTLKNELIQESKRLQAVSYFQNFELAQLLLDYLNKLS